VFFIRRAFSVSAGGCFLAVATRGAVAATRREGTAHSLREGTARCGQGTARCTCREGHGAVRAGHGAVRAGHGAGTAERTAPRQPSAAHGSRGAPPNRSRSTRPWGAHAPRAKAFQPRPAPPRAPPAPRQPRTRTRTLPTRRARVAHASRAFARMCRFCVVPGPRLARKLQRDHDALPCAFQFVVDCRCEAEVTLTQPLTSHGGSMGGRGAGHRAPCSPRPCRARRIRRARGCPGGARSVRCCALPSCAAACGCILTRSSRHTDSPAKVSQF